MTAAGLASVTHDEHVAIVTLSRPEALNAISGALADELTHALREISSDADVWVVVLGAAGDKAFCVGADLKERAGFSLEDFYANREKVRAMFAALRGVAQPTIASVFGFALGGGFELALSCDLIVAADTATFGLPEVRVGLLPAGGGTQLLTRRVGLARAKEMIFTGRHIDAAEAAKLGIVADVVSRDGLHDATMELARDICKSSPIAVREAKRAINAAFGVIDLGMEIEQDAWTRVIPTEDRAEGIAAFNEKRAPVWRNK